MTTTSSNVGIWIDHQHAIIVFAVPGHATVRTMKSHVAAHPHFGGSQVGGGEKKYDERFNHQLTRFYDDVLGQIGEPRSILILGPGEAKQQLAARLARSPAAGAAVAVKAADALTEPQIIAKIAEHFEP
jgi:hypothetical protein